MKTCNQCGMEQQGYVELMSEETIGMVDTSRLVVAERLRRKNDGSEDENDDKAKDKENDAGEELCMVRMRIVMH